MYNEPLSRWAAMISMLSAMKRLQLIDYGMHQTYRDLLVERALEDVSYD